MIKLCGNLSEHALQSSTGACAVARHDTTKQIAPQRCAHFACLDAGDLTQADGLKRLAVFSNSAPDQVPLSEMMLLAANTTTSQIKLRAGMTPRTFDISFNQFSGPFPEWLVEELAQCKEDVTIILDVSPHATQPLYVRGLC